LVIACIVIVGLINVALIMVTRPVAVMVAGESRPHPAMQAVTIVIAHKRRRMSDIVMIAVVMVVVVVVVVVVTHIPDCEPQPRDSRITFALRACDGVHRDRQIVLCRPYELIGAGEITAGAVELALRVRQVRRNLRSS